MKMRHLLPIGTLALSTAAAASVEVGLRSCAALKSADTRLECYDALAESVGHAPDKMLAAPEQPAAEETQRSDHKVDRVTVKASTVVRDMYGKTVVELPNGRFWRQVDNERLHIEPGDTFILERGTPGSPYFILGESERRVRFKRVD